MAELEHVDIEKLLADQPPRANFNVLFVDGTVAMRVAKVLGTFPRHVHPIHDEVWFVYRGGIRIRTDSGDTDAWAGQAVRIPGGTIHRTIALEPDSIVVIINAVGFRTDYLDGDTNESAGYVEVDLPGRNDEGSGGDPSDG